MYYSVKDALVNDNPQQTANQAETLKTYLEANLFPGAKDLLVPVNTICSTKNISKQRDAFALLSTQLITKLAPANLGEVGYVQYCPMKKTKWVGNQNEIKNPYYGKSMLSCGKVIDTIK
jgi:hypothetical protein